MVGDLPIRAPPPALSQVPLLEEGQEKMQRWLQDGEGRLAGLPGAGHDIS